MATANATLRTAWVDAITTEVGNGGKLDIYTAAYATKLLSFTLGTPFAPGGAAGVITLTAPASTTGITNGNAAIARVFKSNDSTMVLEGITVSDSAGSGQVKLQQTGVAIVTSQVCNITSAVITAGNP